MAAAESPVAAPAAAPAGDAPAAPIFGGHLWRADRNWPMLVDLVAISTNLGRMWSILARIRPILGAACGSNSAKFGRVLLAVLSFGQRLENTDHAGSISTILGRCRRVPARLRPLLDDACSFSSIWADAQAQFVPGRTSCSPKFGALSPNDWPISSQMGPCSSTLAESETPRAPFAQTLSPEIGRNRACLSQRLWLRAEGIRRRVWFKHQAAHRRLPRLAYRSAMTARRSARAGLRESASAQQRPPRRSNISRGRLSTCRSSRAHLTQGFHRI